jgi:hypothetical protein
MAIILGGLQDPLPDTSNVVGPITKAYSSGTMRRTATWYRQKPVTSKPLQYNLEILGKLPGDTQSNFLSWSYAPTWASSECQNALAKARERFNAKIGSNAALGVDLAEWKQSHSMIEKRLLQLHKFSRALKRGHFDDAYAAIRGPVPRSPPKGLSRGKSFANNFLEWHFGWSPLIRDIHDACEVLQSPISCKRVRARSGPKYKTWGSQSSNYYSTTTTAATERYRVELGAGIYVSNPNLRLASQLGLVNPLTVAWEVVPFSFVVDWFLPVGNFLNQWSDFVGLTLSEAFTTYSYYSEYRNRYIQYPQYGYIDRKDYKGRVVVERSLGISNFKLRATQFSGFSAVRGLTAMSLLIQQLR